MAARADVLHASHYALAVPPVLMAYANAYGRFSVADNLCGFSYAPVGADNKPTAFPAPGLAQYFGTATACRRAAASTSSTTSAAGGPMRDAVSVSPSTGQQDYNIDGAICLRNLWTGSDANAVRVQNGVNEVLHTANLHGKPAIIVHGRSDTLMPVAFTSRPYFGLNKMIEGGASKLTYIEVTNAQHFDAFIDNAALPGYDARLVPLHYYFLQAMDRMYANLTTGAPLPPSQVVRTTPRGGTPGARAGDHHGQRAADRRHAGRRRPDHVLERRGDHSGLKRAVLRAAATCTCGRLHRIATACTRGPRRAGVAARTRHAPTGVQPTGRCARAG